MEISSFPFLNQEELLPIYGLFSEMDSFSVNQSSQKRRRQDGDGDDDDQIQSSFDGNDLLKLPFWFDHEEKQQQWVMDSNSNFEADFKREFRGSDENFPQFDIAVKKPRRSAAENAAVAVASASPAKGGGGQQRRLWVKDRSKDWWDQCNHPDFPDDEFRRAFRMSKATFDMICKELDSTVMKKDTMLRVAIPVRQRVAVCIDRKSVV